MSLYIKGNVTYKAVQLPKTPDLNKTKVGKQILEWIKKPRAKGKFVKTNAFVDDNGLLIIQAGAVKAQPGGGEWIAQDLETGKFHRVTDASFQKNYKLLPA